MTRTCFFCRKPLPVEQRGTVFCSVRCQELEAQMQAGASGPSAPGRSTSDRSISGGFARTAPGSPHAEGPQARRTPAQPHPRGPR